MAGTPIAGTEGRVTVNGTTINLRKWSVTPQVDDITTTNFESTGGDGKTYEEGIVDNNIRKCEISFEGFWDSAQNPHNNPPNLKAGTRVTNVHLYVKKTGNKRFEFTAMRILSVPVQVEVEGKVELVVNGKSDGEFSYPT